MESKEMQLISEDKGVEFIKNEFELMQEKFIQKL
jgi:hypothetical protein